jgi:uncharacterized protein (TIGR03790 family)
MRTPGRSPAAGAALALVLSAAVTWAAPFAETEPATDVPAVLHSADDPSSVLVVANASVPASLRLAQEYANARSLPASNILAIDAPAGEEIDRQTFETSVLGPIQDHLWKTRTVETTAYIVLVKGVPLKIAGTEGTDGNRASVDSELALLYARMVKGPYPLNGRIPNPYFAADPAFTGAAHVAPAVEGAPKAAPARRWGLYLVTRLDGYTEDDVRALFAHSMIAGGKRGRFVFVLRGSGEGDVWMERAADTLRALGADVLVGREGEFPTGLRGVLGFCSWGSNDGRYPGRGPRYEWVPGAIATGFVSSDARTFHEPPPSWRPGPFRNQEAYFEGTPQSLIGDLVREGASGAIGNAYEPYLDACARPEILFPAYLAGYNLAEACYLALPYLSWQSVVIGDPLCRIAVH